MLLERGVDIMAKNSQGKMATEEAFDRNFMDISEILAEKEMELNKDIVMEEDATKDEDMAEENNEDEIAENFEKNANIEK